MNNLKRKTVYTIICLFFSLIVIILGTIFFTQPQKVTLPITVKIGVLMPFNSDLKTVAEKMKNGMEMAREDLIEKYKGALKIEMVYENGCYEPEAAAAVQKFVQLGIGIIGGSFCLFGHIPILALTEANKIITFNTAANPDVVLHKKYAFSTNVEIQDEAQKMARFAYYKVGGRRAITMHLDTPFGHDYNKYFKREFEKLGGELLFNIPNVPDGKSFTGVIPKIKAANPNLIITAHFGVPLGTFYKEVRKAGITAPIISNYEAEDLDVLNTAGNAAEGIIISSSELETKTSTMREFESRYIKRFGIQPDDVVTNSYDDIILAVESHIKCTGERDCMREELHKVENYPGTSGMITINPSGAASKPTTFKIIKNRNFVRYIW